MNDIVYSNHYKLVTKELAGIIRSIEELTNKRQPQMRDWIRADQAKKSLLTAQISRDEKFAGRAIVIVFEAVLHSLEERGDDARNSLNSAAEIFKMLSSGLKAVVASYVQRMRQLFPDGREKHGKKLAPLLVELIHDYSDVAEITHSAVASGRKVFICSNGKDHESVIPIVTRLNVEGFSTSYYKSDEDSPLPNRSLLEQLETEITECPVFVVMLGAHGLTAWQEAECNLAVRLELNKERTKGHIIPAVLAETEGEPRFPFGVCDLPFVDFRATTPDPMLRLIRGIRDALSR